MKKEYILQVGVTVGSERDILDHIFASSAEGKQQSIIAINPEKIMKAHEDPELYHILNEAEIAIPDGVGVLIGSKMQDGKVRDRVTGVDMMEKLFAESAQHGESVFLYGASPGVAERAAENLLAKYPETKVAGILDGYVKDEEQIVRTIHESGASILFVALGSPTQENFIRRNRERLPNVHIFQGVGGSFDVFSGEVERAPELFRKAGMEWFYRLVKEPKRLKRQLQLPKFLLRVLRQK